MKYTVIGYFEQVCDKFEASRHQVKEKRNLNLNMQEPWAVVEAYEVTVDERNDEDTSVEDAEVDICNSCIALNDVIFGIFSKHSRKVIARIQLRTDLLSLGSERFF